MSDERGSDKVGREKGKTRGWWVIKTILVGVIAVGILVVLGSYGLRTPAVLGQILGPRISDQIEDRGIALRIGTMSGVGFTGIRFYDVEMGVQSGGKSVVGRARYIDIYPDLRESLSAGRPVIASVIVEEGTLDMAGREDEDALRSGNSQTNSKEGESRWERWFSEEVHLQIGELEASLDGVGERAFFEEVHVVVRPAERRLIDVRGKVSAAGVGLSFETREDRVYVEIPPSALDELLAGIPVDVTIGGFSMGHGQVLVFLESRSVEDLPIGLHDLRVRSRQGSALMMEAEESRIEGDDIAIRWRAEEAKAVGDARGYDLEAVELAYRQDVSGFGFQAEVHDGEGGRVELEGQWHLPTSLVGLNIWVHDFLWDGTMPWPTEQGSPIRHARVNGVFHGDVDLIHRLIAVDGQFSVRHLEMNLPFVASEPLLFDEVHVELPLTVDLRGRAASVVNGEVGLGGLEPLSFDGRIVDAGGSYVFDFEMAGEEIDSGEITAHVPPVLLGAIEQTTLEGLFGVEVLTSGHSAYPNSLVLEVNFSGGVEVIEDISWDKVEALRSADGTFFDSDAHPGRTFRSNGWTDFDALPVHIPAAVLSAEDAAFFEHEGLDWRGLRMAAVHNLQERALVRGGSTITQQVAKNVFLTHDRTVSRKLQEAFLTWRLESALSKQQILELYLNVAQWGPEIHGLVGAANYYFEKDPEDLSALEAVLLASILPSPIRFGGAVRAGYLPSSREDKMRRVLVNMRFVGDLSWADYFAAERELNEGMVGSRRIEICADDDTAPEGAIACDEIDLVVDEEENEVMDWDGAERFDEAGWVPLTH